MVGVPRSKGCLTCRKRKIACDQEKPECRTCRRRRVPCEGYAQFPTVIQWTVYGPKKRRRFEETEGLTRPPKSTESSESLETAQPRPLNEPSSLALLLPSHVPAGRSVIEQINASCLDSYLPQAGPVKLEVKNSWMWSMISKCNEDDALSHSFAAMSLARLGRIRNDEDLISQSRSRNAVALQSLQNALYDPSTAFQGRTLAAIRSLSIYELLSPTFAAVPAGKAHDDGMEQWARAARPECICDDFAFVVFLDVRWFMMTRSIERHKSSILGEEGWRTIPWRNTTKDCLQRLFDIGFRLATLLEKIDSTEPANESQQSKLSQECTNVRNELEMWLSDYLFERRLHESFVESEMALETPNSDFHTSISHADLTNLWDATNVVYYWTLMLLLNNMTVSLTQQINRHSSPNKSSPRSITSDTSTTTMTTDTEEIADQNLELATEIVLAKDHFLADDTGWLGPQRYFFALRQAMQCLGKAKSPLLGDAQMALGALIGRLRPRC